MCDGCDCSENAELSFEDKVKDIIFEIRPMLQGHGGDIEFVKLEEDKTVKVRLQGAGSGCPGVMMTLKQGVERMLKEKLPEVKEVVAVD